METGEFAAKSPATAAPAKERKGGKGAVIGMIFFALVAVGLGVWVAILLLNPMKCNNGSSNSSDGSNGAEAATNCLPSEDKTETKDYDKIIRSIVDDLAAAAGNLTGDSRNVLKTYDGFVWVDVNDDLMVDSSRAYGIYVKDVMLKVSEEKIDSAFSPIYAKYGLKKTTSGAFGSRNYKSDDGIYCTYYGPSAPYDAFCAHSSWVDKTNTDLAISLQKAYGKRVAFKVDASTIAKSKSGNYETVTAFLEGARESFYRKVGDSEWTYFLGGQAAPSCDEFNTDVLKEAYEGTACENSKTHALDTVKR